MNITRLVPGRGCETLLLQDEKTLLWDTGMLHCGEECVRLVREQLRGEPLDYIALSHSHYDHVGALGLFREAFPSARVLASSYCAYVFTREGARRVIREMSETAAEQAGTDPKSLPPMNPESFSIDESVGSGDRLCLGASTLVFYDTPGHTKDSISVRIEESETLILSESCGIVEDGGWVHVPALTSCRDCLASIDLCESLHPETLYCAHHGLVLPSDGYEAPSAFFARARACFGEMLDMARACAQKGFSDEELEQYFCDNVHRKYIISEGQPEEAFRLNTRAFIRCLHREYPDIFEKAGETP